MAGLKMPPRNYVLIYLILSGILITTTESGYTSGYDETFSGPNQGNQNGPKTLDDLFAELAARVPAFGGMFLDGDILKVYLAGVAPMAAVEGAIAAVFGRERIPRGGIQVLQGQFGFLQLRNWHNRLGPLFGIAGVVFTDVDEGINRLKIGVTDYDLVAPIQQEALGLGVPLDALVIVQTEPIMLAATLRDQIRPIQGGIQIAFSVYVCTLGFNAIRVSDGAQGFVTNSHCTNTQGGVESTSHYQPTVASGNFIGTEIADPTYTSAKCPAGLTGYVCRYSDSAFSERASGVSADLGLIARPSSVGSLTIAGTFRIVREFSTLVGQTLSKVGRTTGWTQGQVTNTCGNVGVSGTNIVQLCQDIVSAGLGAGDSGSPVFFITNSPQTYDIELRGILWGGNPEGTQFTYSPIGNIQRSDELGELTTEAPTPANTVTFYTNPTSFTGGSGTIIFSGTAYTNGQTGNYASGDYSATASAPSGYQFVFWQYSGSSGSGVYVPNIGTNPTTVQVRGAGWLKAVFSAQVTFYTNPSNVGSISWGSCSNPSKTNGQTVYDANLPPDYSNSITACANVPSGYVFSGWSCTGGLSCSGSSTSTTVTFTGPGSITASFSAVGTDDAEITSNDIPTSMTAGQSYTVHVTVRNTGTNTWTASAGYRLGSPGDSDPFAFPRVELDSSASVGSGQTYTFIFTMTAPSSTGSYTTDWRMLREGVTWFGETLTKTVTVTPTTSYVLHVQSIPMTGVGITWTAGTGSQTGYTNFDIGPYTAGFTVTLTAPGTYGGYTFSHWTLDGSNMGSSLSLPVAVDDSHKERTAVAVYSAGSFGQTVTAVFSGSDTVGFMMTGTLVDDSAMGFIYAHRGAPKVLFTKTDTSRVQSSGQPTWSGYAHLVTVGGPGANPTVKYYEDQGLAPLRYAGTSTQVIIMYGSEVKLDVPLSSINQGNDYFVMEVVADGSHKVIMLWGVGGWGTYASGVYFDGKFTDMASLTDGWYIMHWQDLNGNGVPDYGAEFTVVASGP